mgnify:CR=1 FL=1
MKFNWEEIETSVAESFPKEKYKAFCEMILDHEMTIKYLQSPEGKEAVGVEVAISRIKEEESLIRRIKVQKQSIRNYYT